MNCLLKMKRISGIWQMGMPQQSDGCGVRKASKWIYRSFRALQTPGGILGVMTEERGREVKEGGRRTENENKQVCRAGRHL